MKKTSVSKEDVKAFASKEYQFGFETDIESETFQKGLNEEVIRALSKKKNEPSFMLDFRLDAYKKWLEMKEPRWSENRYEKIDFNDFSYYSAPKKMPKHGSLDEVDPKLLETFDRLGVPLSEQKRLMGVAVDAVFDSVSVGTTHQKILREQGIIFCSISEAMQERPDLIKKYLGSVVPSSDNFYAALNSAVFSDGSFCYIPKGIKSPLDLSTYFRINSAQTGQFERTLIVCEEGGYANYLEGCTAPMRDTNQLHAAVVEIVVMENATINYSTVQNWYAGDEKGEGGVYNFVTKRGLCKGKKSKITWTQIEAGSAVTWKYPSVVLEGDGSIGEFYSVALTNNKMQADTGTKMIHIGENTSSKIISKGICLGESVNVYRGLVKVLPNAKRSKNYTQCDSLLVGRKCRAVTYPYIEMQNSSSQNEHEASASRVSEEQMFYLNSRGIRTEKAVSLILNGFCKDVFEKLPMEYSVEAVKLLEMKLEESVG